MMRFAPASIAVLAAALAAASAVSAQPLTDAPRTADGHPDLSGVWQAIGTAHWDLEPHVQGYPVIDDLGAQIAMPPGAGVVEGGDIPYLPEALVERDRRFANRAVEDPETNCYMGGVPRSTYMPYPFQILQNERDVAISYQYATAFRRIFVGGDQEAPLDSWMGWSNGKWDGDTLVIDVQGFNELSWFDRAGNHHSNQLQVVERYTPRGENHIDYVATITDPRTFTRPWTIRMPLYRRIEPNVQLLEFKCVEFSEELLYGDLKKKTE